MRNMKKFGVKYYKTVYPKIIEALRLVAAPPEIQLSSLPRYVHKPDEVALTFEEVMVYAKIILDNHFLTDELYERLLEIDELFNGFGKDEWTEEAMYQSGTWEVVRNKANDTLKKFGEDYAAPNLYWITYVAND